MGKKSSKPRGKPESVPRARGNAPAREKAGKRGSAAERKRSKALALDEAERKRRLGLRGAAPWAARHAAKHAAEARARNAEPPRPGSARATLRVPDEAERIKARVSELHAVLVRIRTMRKALPQGFYEMGELLREIQEKKLYDAKGYNSFEAFAEREIDLSKSAVLKLARIPNLFRREAADYGLDALFAALTALDEITQGPGAAPPAKGRQPLPLKPPGSSGKE